MRLWLHYFMHAIFPHHQKLRQQHVQGSVTVSQIIERLLFGRLVPTDQVILLSRSVSNSGPLWARSKDADQIVSICMEEQT